MTAHSSPGGDAPPRISEALARPARRWLWLGVLALIGAGLLAVVLVLARTPGVGTVLPLKDVFRAALVVHVDLSVLIWFMAFAAMLWSGLARPGWEAVDKLAWVMACAGTTTMLVAPFLPDARPLLNNYIPMLDQPVFLGGLASCGVGFGLAILRALALGWPLGRGGAVGATGHETGAGGGPGARQDTGDGADRGARVGAWLAALAGALAWLLLAVNLTLLPRGSDVGYYELLFWGPGHVLQFQHALLVAVCWMLLLRTVRAADRRPRQVPRGGYTLAAAPLLAVPVIAVCWPVGADMHATAYARLMEWGHLLMLPLMLPVITALPAVWRAKPSPERSALLASLLLFGVGGLLAFMIRGANVVVPAHYHGSIVGVTLAFMGVVYGWLPRLGFRSAGGALARWQPYVYGGGQLTHILGLAWSGGYGVQRKVPGTDQLLITLSERIGMGMMGLGGLVAVIGGVMFVWVCLRSMLPARS